MRVVQSNPDWNFVAGLGVISLIACLVAFLIYKGKL
jgi:hypothetical protein